MTVEGVGAWIPIGIGMTDRTDLKCQQEIGDLVQEVIFPNSETEMADLVETGNAIVKVVSKFCSTYCV